MASWPKWGLDSPSQPTNIEVHSGVEWWCDGWVVFFAVANRKSITQSSRHRSTPTLSVARQAFALQKNNPFERSNKKRPREDCTCGAFSI